MAKVDNEALLQAGLEAMAAAGKPLTKLPTKSRAMKYALADGKTVRVRTCNDHILVVLADSAGKSANLNIEGTDYLLIVMPEVPRTPGPVISYFVPCEVAVEAVRRTHAEWLASKPNTKGDNRTWNIWFDDNVSKAGGFAKKWAQYRLTTSGTTESLVRGAESTPHAYGKQTLADVIAAAKLQIAAAAGVSPDAVKITLEV